MNVSKSSSAQYKVDPKKYAENYQRIFNKKKDDEPREDTGKNKCHSDDQRDS